MELADQETRAALLPGVSRTFALTIPELPEPLRPVVTNCYLLCRIADTIEDEPQLGPEDGRRFHQHLADAVDGKGDPEAFARDLTPLLSDRTLAAERELVAHSALVIRVSQTLPARQRAAVRRCVRILCEGMPRFRPRRGRRGLADCEELARYCYCVAGAVGEMLTELFCDHSPEIDARREELQALAVSFGQGLQLTNILKDIWEDLERGYCWLPADVFRRAGFDLGDLKAGPGPAAFREGLGALIVLAHENLRDALEYTLLIPASETRIRHFCLWAIGMAVLTLRKINAHRDFRSSREVKISRNAVRMAIMASNLTTRNDRALRMLFALSSKGLPAPHRAVAEA